MKRRNILAALAAATALACQQVFGHFEGQRIKSHTNDFGFTLAYGDQVIRPHPETIYEGQAVYYVGIYSDCFTPNINRHLPGTIEEIYEVPAPSSKLFPNEQFINTKCKWRQGNAVHDVFACELSAKL